MDNNLFRKKSLERISSPDQLDQYMRVTNPGVWMVLVAVIILLLGFVVAASTIHLESTCEAVAQIQNGVATFQVEDAQADRIAQGMTVRIKNMETAVQTIEWVSARTLKVTAPAELPDGEYPVVVVIEKIPPIRFLFSSGLNVPGLHSA